MESRIYKARNIYVFESTHHYSEVKGKETTTSISTTSVAISLSRVYVRTTPCRVIPRSKIEIDTENDPARKNPSSKENKIKK